MEQSLFPSDDYTGSWNGQCRWDTYIFMVNLNKFNSIHRVKYNSTDRIPSGTQKQLGNNV